jgi:hypothetical protein
MFDRMGHTRDIRLVTEISNINVKSCAGLVRIRIIDQKRLELIVEANNSIIALVE